MEDSKAEIKADLEGESKQKGVVVGQWKEVLRSEAATVIRTDPSCLVVKMDNGEVYFSSPTKHNALYLVLLVTVWSFRWSCRYWRRKL